MIDLYKIAFVVTLIILVTAAGLLFLIVPIGSESGILEYLSVLASLLGGVAGLTAAVAAFMGIDAWKKQITHGRYLAAIWDAKVNLRKVQGALIECSVIQSVQVNKTDDQFEQLEKDLAIRKEQLKACESDFKDSCGVLDRVVTKNDWEWQNHASHLKMCATAFLNQPVVREVDMRELHIYFTERIGLYEQHDKYAKALESKLDGLEMKYS